MLTAGDAPADFADKRANPATKKRLSFAPQERSERDSDRDAAEGSSAPLPPQDALPRATEETLRETAQDESEPAAAPGDGFAAVETLTANALQARDEALLSIEELLKKVACDIASDVEAVPAAALAASQGEAAPAADDAEIAVRETEAAPAVALAVPQGEAPPAGAEAAPAVSQGEAPSAGAEAEEASAATEAELSISKALDSIEKEIEEWENRDRLSTASKVAMLISVIFLIFTGGSALVKNFAPHSPLDLWFDSVQLQAAATIKHSVDAVRVLFDGEDDESQESASQRER
ncbi:MAG: hypothetical protein LBB57_05240 [Clostridiales Family XIII bacterium]|jgi:hypothetical protein|nr:hypothetical protein [Clostridiales Family XIII bacterium]